MTDSERGKRKLAYRLLTFQAVLVIIGLWFPTASEEARFYAPFLIPSAIALFVADGHFANQLQRTRHT